MQEYAEVQSVPHAWFDCSVPSNIIYICHSLAARHVLASSLIPSVKRVNWMTLDESVFAVRA